MAEEQLSLCMTEIISSIPNINDRINHGLDLRKDFQRTGDISRLRASVLLLTESLKQCPVGHELRPKCLSTLAASLFIQFQRFGDIADLDAVILYQHEALALCPPGDPHHSTTVHNVAASLHLRFAQTGNREDLDSAIALHEEALSLHPPGNPLRSWSLANIATALKSRFKITGEETDLDTSIRYQEEALELCPPSHPERFRALNDVADARKERFEKLGNPADLDSAIVHYRQALDLLPRGHISRPQIISSFARALQMRFDRIGDQADIDSAVQYHQEAVEQCPPGHASRSSVVESLGIALQARFTRLRDPADVDSAILCHKEAVELRPPGHQSRDASLNSLALALRERFKLTKNQEDLDTAIIYHQEVLNITPIGYRAGCLNNLANALKMRFSLTNNLEDLNSAIHYLEEAVDLYPIGNPLRSMSVNNLASARWTFFDVLYLTHEMEKHPKYLTEEIYDQQARIISLLEEGATDTVSSIEERFHALQLWMSFALKYYHGSALRAHMMYLELHDLSLLLSRSLDAQHQRIESSRIKWKTQYIAMDAAALAINEDNLELAIELLEQGRSTILNHLGRFRTRLDDLRSIDSALADRFTDLSYQLDRKVTSNPKGAIMDEGPSDPFEDDISRFQELVQKWNEVVDEIRSVEGFDTFLRQPSYEALRAAACNGPVVVLNTSDQHSDALIVRYTDSPLLVPLPNVSPQSIEKLSQDLKNALALDSDALFVERKRTAIAEILKFLWLHIAQPVVQALSSSGNSSARTPNGKTRIWWIPTANLWNLPLHAAGIYQNGDGAKLSDRFISSYTPSLSALIHSIESCNASNAEYLPRLLVVTVPSADHDGALIHVSREASAIQDAVSTQPTFLQDTQATWQVVLSSMRDHSWVHFACHGSQVDSKPFKSCFKVRGKPLSRQHHSRRTTSSGVGVSCSVLLGC